MKRYLIAVLVGIAAVALVGAACGGGDDDTGSNDDPTSASDDGNSGDGDSSDGDSSDGDSADGDSSDGDSADGDSGDGDSADGDSSDGDSGDGDSDSGLASVLAAANALSSENSYRVVYEISGDSVDGEFTGTFTVSSDPPQQLFAMEGTSDGEDFSFVVISDGDTSYLCTAAEGEGLCLETGADGNSPFELPGLFNAPELIGSFTTDDDVTVSPTDGRNIAGQDAKCYDVSSVDGDALVCVNDDDDTLLLVEVVDGEDTFTMVVTEYGNPIAAEFEPPYPVTDLFGGN